MPSMALASVQNSPPSPNRRSPLANNGRADLELGHSRTSLIKERAPSGIEIPNPNGYEGGSGYTSICDILSSPQYAPAAGGNSCGDIHMIRHPLVKHAVYAYLQITPCTREDPTHQTWQSVACSLLLGCFNFIGAFIRT